MEYMLEKLNTSLLNYLIFSIINKNYLISLKN